jgi:thiamine-phosphate pyrophosphorylase
MTPIVISYHLKVHKEIDLIKRLIENGLDNFHIRKPDFSVDEMRAFIDKIPCHFHSKIMLHSHYQLVKEYNLRGIHFNKKYNAYIPDYLEKHHKVSVFCNSFDDIDEYSHLANYFFIGPVFKSISLVHYYGKYSHDYLKKQLQNYRRVNTVAIGGIDEETAAVALKLGFKQVSVLGAIWAEYIETQDVVRVINRYKAIKNVTFAMYN